MQSVRSFTGLRATPSAPVQAKSVAVRGRRMAVVPRADGAFLGSSVNQAIIVSTTLFLVAGRFGLAPTATRHTTAGLKLYEDKSAGLSSGDPSGFTAVDVLALGALGHIFGVGLVLGLKATGTL